MIQREVTVILVMVLSFAFATQCSYSIFALDLEFEENLRDDQDIYIREYRSWIIHFRIFQFISLLEFV